ncbi:MAG: ribonuclease R [Patescibacteria group bacterium]
MSHQPYLEGILKVSTKGVGYVTVKGGKREEAIEIEPAFLGTGLAGDRVKVLIHSAGDKSKNGNRTGEIVEILDRRKVEFVGVVEAENDFYYLVPDDKRVYKDILIARDQLAGAKAGDKVLAKIIKWDDPKKDPLGTVLEVIGRPGLHDTEMRAIVLDRGFQTNFPTAVEAEAKTIKEREMIAFPNEIEKRLDYRSVPTMTIDPIDAKDFDDALSIKEIGKEQWEVGVHIADVSHYVRPETKLDAEAKKRATSIYLVDRTIPMLPEILSNDLCSLNPNEDKLTFSAIFTMNRAGEILSTRFAKTVIRSQKRLTYEEGQAILDKKNGPLADELTVLNQLAERLRQKKIAGGAITFENEEIKFELDAAGRPVRVFKKIRTAIHLLVEDFMLLANRAVAEYISKLIDNRDHHFIYRVHDLPDQDKLKQLADFLRPLGYRLPFKKGGVASGDLNRFLESVAGRPEETMIRTAVMRSMAKAVYDTKNIGHYGLAFPHYTHFTSPIRRYPDVMVHRLLEIYLSGRQPSAALLKDYRQLAAHVSLRELEAQDAERDSIKYKQAEFMQTKIGQVLNGIISGLAKWGIYIQEEETLAEGMVRLTEMADDYYIFDEKNYALVGERTKKRWRLGDRVRVKVIGADPAARLIDFKFI